MKLGGLNLKVTGALIFVAMVFIMLQVYGKELKYPVKVLLESDLLKVVVWSCVAAVLFLHAWLYGARQMQLAGFIYDHFGFYAEVCFAIATYGFASTTSLALIKGFYLQIFYEGQYYTGFDGFDLASMFLLSCFLLFYCVFHIASRGKEVLFHGDVSVVQVKPK